MTNFHPRDRASRRPGSILAVALVGLLVASLLGLSLLKTLLIHHRQMGVIGARQQAFWLAEAGAQRAIQRLANSPDYSGEEWEVPIDVLNTGRSAVVTIEVFRPAEETEAEEIHVVARLDHGVHQPSVFRRELRIGGRRAGETEPPTAQQTVSSQPTTNNG